MFKDKNKFIHYARKPNGLWIVLKVLMLFRGNGYGSFEEYGEHDLVLAL